MMSTDTTLSAYDVWSKVQHTRQAQADFLELYGERVSPFTSNQYFYFIIHNGKKFVHKQSLKYIYTNRGTFTLDEGLDYCKLVKEFTPIDIVSILENEQLPFMPRLLDANEQFLVYEFTTGEMIQHITADDYYECKRIHAATHLTPFYNSINGNMIRTVSGIVLIDFKQLDPIDQSQPFYVYLRWPNATELHVDSQTDVDPIIQMLDDEFSTKNLTTIRHP